MWSYDRRRIVTKTLLVWGALGGLCSGADYVVHVVDPAITNHAILPENDGSGAVADRPQAPAGLLDTGDDLVGGGGIRVLGNRVHDATIGELSKGGNTGEVKVVRLC